MPEVGAAAREPDPQKPAKLVKRGFAVLKEPVADASVKKTVPLTVGELTLDRAVRCQALITPTQPWVVTMPASNGFAMTSLRVTSSLGTGSNPATLSSTPVKLDITVGGCVESYWSVLVNETTNLAEVRFDPPLIAAPGATFSIAFSPATLYADAVTRVAGGYLVYPGEV